MRKEVLAVSNDRYISTSLFRLLGKKVDYELCVADKYSKSLELAVSKKPKLALIDIRIGQENVRSLVSVLKRINAKAVCVMMAEFNNLNKAVQAVVEGADDYVVVPFEAESLSVLLESYFAQNILAQNIDKVTRSYGSLLHGSSQMIFLLDSKGNVIEANLAVHRYLNIDLDFVLKKKVWNLPWTEFGKMMLEMLVSEAKFCRDEISRTISDCENDDIYNVCLKRVHLGSSDLFLLELLSRKQYYSSKDLRVAHLDVSKNSSRIPE